MSLLKVLAVAIGPNPVSIGATTKKSHYDLLYDAIVALEGRDEGKLAADLTAAKAITAGRAVSLNREGEATPDVGFVLKTVATSGSLNLRVLVSRQTGTTFAALDHRSSGGQTLDVRLGTVATDGSITFGSATQIDTGIGTRNFDAGALDSTRQVVVWVDNPILEAAIITEASGTYTVGTPVTIEADVTTQDENRFLVVLSSTNFVVVYHDTVGGDVRARAGTVSGSTITLGTEVILDGTAGSRDFSGSLIGSGKALFAWNTGATGITKCHALTVSGNVITTGTTTTIADTTETSAPVNATFNVAMGDDIAVVAMVMREEGGDTTSAVHIFVVTIDGTVPLAGAPYEFGGEDRDVLMLTSFTAAKYNSRTLLMISEQGEVGQLQMIVMRLTGDNAIRIQETGFILRDSGAGAFIGRPTIGDLQGSGANFANRFVIGHAESGSSSRYRVVEYYDDLLGVAEAAISAAATGAVAIAGVADTGLSGLTAGDFLWSDNTGVLSTQSKDGKPVGVALSATELMLLRGEPHP